MINHVSVHVTQITGLNDDNLVSRSRLVTVSNTIGSFVYFIDGHLVPLLFFIQQFAQMQYKFINSVASCTKKS